MATVNTYNIGNVARSSAAFVGEDELPKDPTSVTVEYQINNGAIETKHYNVDGFPDTIIRDDVGNYHIDIETEIAGTYDITWSGTGAVVAAGPDTFKVRVEHVA